MIRGTLDQTFEILIEGIEFPSLTTFNVPSLHLTANLEKETPFRLKIHIENSTEDEAVRLANKFAMELYTRLLLRFAFGIVRSETPLTIQQSFTGSGMSPTTITRQHITGKARIEPAKNKLPKTEVDAFARDVEIRAITPQQVTSAQLHTAVNMYTVAIESSDKVTRFLVFYSALALASLFKIHDGSQSSIDNLMLSVRSSIPCTNSPKGKRETLYTMLRNNLIHAEERGCNPRKSVTEIEKHINDFQEIVSLVFQSL